MANDKKKSALSGKRRAVQSPLSAPLEAVEFMEEFLALPKSMREAVEHVIGGAAAIDEHLQRNGRDSKQLYKFIARLLIMLIDDSDTIEPEPRQQVQ